MRLELNLFGTGLGVSTATRNVVFNEVWIAEALKTAWMVWTELGWDSKRTLKIGAKNWRNFGGETVELEVIDKIARFNRVVRHVAFNLNSDWKSGWILILEIAEMIKRYDIYLETNDEVYHFRLLVAKFLATGIMKGMGKSCLSQSEFFIFETRDRLGDIPFEYDQDVDVTFQSAKSDTKVSAIDASLASGDLKCICFTVFVSDSE